MSAPRLGLGGSPPDADDPALERLERDRKPGELESGMLTGTDDGEISATERFEGDLEPEEALEVLSPTERRR